MMFTLVTNYQKGGQTMKSTRNTATWGNVDLADNRAAKGHFATKEAYEAYVDLLEAWDEALEEDKERDPDKCGIVDFANVGYGPDEAMTCGHSSTKLVTFESYDQESDTWYNVQEKVCKFHAQVIADDTIFSNTVRNVHVQDKTVSTDK